MTPLFTIIMPTYNQAKFLAPALDSLLAQTEPDWEAVIVNDGSTDDTAAVLDRYARADRRFRPVHQPNGGTGAALNTALAHAGGQWICWLSSDDLFEPEKLAIHRKAFEVHPECRFFFTRFRLLRESTGVIEDRELWGPLPEPRFQIPGLFYRNYISGISICVRRDSWEAAGRFNPHYRYAQDYEMWLRLLARHPGVFLPERTCTSRNHDAQGSETFPQACLYDTAKAAIRFINEHSLPELLPLLNLNDPKAASEALIEVLRLASLADSFLYAMGPHPALLLRVLEWAFAEGGPEPSAVASQLASLWPGVKDTALALHWQAARACCAVERPSVSFSAVHPQQVGLAGYLHNPAVGRPLAEYLRRFDQLEVGEQSWDVARRREVLLVAPQPFHLDLPPEDVAASKVTSTLAALTSRGHRVLLLARGTKTLQMYHDALALGWRTDREKQQIAAGLDTLDVVFSDADDSITVRAAHQVTMGAGIDAHELALQIETLPPRATPSAQTAPGRRWTVTRIANALKRRSQNLWRMARPGTRGGAS